MPSSVAPSPTPTSPSHPPSVRESLTAAVLEAAVVGGMFACLEAWIVPLLQGPLGAPAAVIGTLTMLPQLAAIVCGPFSGALIRWLGGPRRVAIHHCWTQVVGFAVLEIPLAAAADGHPPSWAVPLAVLMISLMNGAGAVLGGPAWMAWMGGLIPHRVMGRYTSHRNRIFHISRLTFALLFMGIMHELPLTRTIAGLQVILAIAAVSRLGSTLLQLRQIDPGHRPGPKASASRPLATIPGSFTSFLRELNATGFGRFTLVWSLFNFGLMIAGPYYATYLVAKPGDGGLDLGGQAVLYSILIYTNTVTRLLCLPWAGRLVDRLGPIAVFRQAILFMAFIPVGWTAAAASGHWWPILLTEILSGFAWSLADASVGPMIFRCHPDPDQRARLIAWHATIFNLCCIAGTGIGMAVLALLPASLGHPYLVLFLLTLAMRFPAVVLGRRLLTESGPPKPAVALWRMIPGADASVAFGVSILGRFRRMDED